MLHEEAVIDTIGDEKVSRSPQVVEK